MKYLVLPASLCLASIVSASADFTPTPLQLNTVYDTGYANGVELTAPASDDHFSIRSAPIGDSVAGSTPLAAQVADPVPSGWYQATASTPGEYISPVEDQAYPAPPAEGDLPGFYDYQAVLPTTFDTPTWLTVSGYYAADNTATVEVDGIAIKTGPMPPTSQYAGLSYFSDTFEVGPGSVTTDLDFVVENYNSDNSDPTLGSDGLLNPTGLFVTDLDAVVVPEPSTWVMMLVGLAACALAPRLRRTFPI